MPVPLAAAGWLTVGRARLCSEKCAGAGVCSRRRGDAPASSRVRCRTVAPSARSGGAVLRRVRFLGHDKNEFMCNQSIVVAKGYHDLLLLMVWVVVDSIDFYRPAIVCVAVVDLRNWVGDFSDER